MDTVPDDTRPGPVRHRALLAPDAFKGTATAPAIADAMATGARRAGWDTDVCPLSDGGEGFVDVLAAASIGGPPSGAWHETTVPGPLGTPVVARWWMADGVAVVESAAASGLPLVGGAEGNDPVRASTRGTGALLVVAAAAGARRALVGVGGSATTDGGRGALEAIDEAGGLGAMDVVVACDVDTRFVQAAEQFGPQKGATPAQVVELGARLAALATDLRARFGVDVTDIPGSGAAGGLAGGLAALGARLVPGFGVVADAVGLEGRMAGVDVVVTGEGRLDGSSWSGKVVGGVVAGAHRAGVPVLVVAGAVGPGGVEGRPDATVEVRSLSDRFGAGHARRDPAGCAEEVVAERLDEGFGAGPGRA
jgi:glycerate kinase